MKFADEKNMYNGWSIDTIQEQIMGVEKKNIGFGYGDD